MVDFDLKIVKEELSGRLQKLMFLRVLFVSLLLGASIFIQIKETKTYFGDIQTSHYALIAAIYFLTFVYVISLRYIKNLRRVAYAQLLIDTLFITVLIYVTGGIDSIFSFLYILTIINSSIILYRRGGMIIASAGSILYGLLLDLHYYNVIHPLGSRLSYTPGDQSGYIFFMIIVNITAFYLVAFLSSYPSEQARKSSVELKARQDDIIKLEALNEWIIRSITSGLITLDDDYRIILFNPAAEDVFSIKAGNAIGRNILDILPFLKNIIRGQAGFMKTEMNSHGFADIPFQKKDGESLSLRFSVSPLILPEGEQGGLILSFQDMTKMKQIEEEMKRVEGLALVGELAASIAHEIRNPMASISGSIQMLNEGSDQDEVKRRLMGIILREIGRLDNLVDDFLLFCRPKETNWLEFNLNQLIMDSLELIKNSGKWIEKINIETSLDKEVIMKSDPEQIRQVLWNLFLNSSEAMPRGGSLIISTDIVEGEDTPSPKGKMVKIVIRDTGSGFSQKALSHLFTPFFTTKQGGSGLGLPMVKRIVEGLKGKVYGRNHDGGGAEITIFLYQVPSPSL